MKRMPGTLLLVALVMAGCDDDSSGPDGPRYTGAEARAIPENGLAWEMVVRGEGWDSATVVALDGGGAPVGRGYATPFEGDSVARPFVVGLLPSASYALAVTLWDGSTPSAGPDTLPIATGALPAWIPAMGTAGTPPASPSHTALSLPDGGVIVDEQGRVRWYRHSPNGVLNSFQRHANGAYTLLSQDEVADGFLLLDPAGRTVGNLTCVGRPTRFHDVRIEADGSAWVLCDETRVMDLSGLGGNPAAMVMGTVLQRLDPSGTLAFEWNAFDHFAITDLPAPLRMGESVNFTHGNSIAVDTDGHPILSFRSLSEVTKIDRATGDVLWRLGGLAGQFTFANDPKGLFERQHGVRVAGPALLQMLDNGDAAPSRMVRYLVNPETLVATMLWEFADGLTHTFVGGSSDALPGGGGLVSFGQAGRVFETDAAGNQRWQLTGLDGTYVFRAERVPAP